MMLLGKKDDIYVRVGTYYTKRDEKNMEELLPRNWAKSNQTCSE